MARTAWKLTRNSDGALCHVFVQEDPPGNEYLGAWGNPSTLTLTSYSMAYQEELHWVRQKRAEAYPPLHSLADGLYHAAHGDELPLQAYYSVCEQVKERYPKPEVPEGYIDPYVEPTETDDPTWWQLLWS